MIVATIDIGTNAVLLLVAEWDGKGLKVLRDEARITRLGEGLHDQPVFLSEAQERTLAVLRDYLKICHSLSVEKIVAVGTAAFRKAKNAVAFVERVGKETGLRIEIIPGEEEARLSWLSVATDFPNEKNRVALDIGGGSTEIITEKGAVSLDLGAVILTERIVKHDPPTEGEVQRMVDSIGATLRGCHIVGQTRGSAPTLIGLAGSVTTLSAIKQGLTVWDGAKVQGSLLTLKEIDRMISLFRRTTNEERRTIPGMVAGREDTILSGTFILKMVMEKIGTDRVIVSDRGLRYGVVRSL